MNHPMTGSTREAAVAAGYLVDTHVYPWVAYKGPRFNPSEWFTCAPDHGLEPRYKERDDVLTFQRKLNIPMAMQPSFLDENAHDFRAKFMLEELVEFADAYKIQDLQKAADALVDLAYVLHGTALMMGLPWGPIWEAVHTANMQKTRARTSFESLRGSTLDAVKPEGWEAPDHQATIGPGPWPTFNATAASAQSNYAAERAVTFVPCSGSVNPFPGMENTDRRFFAVNAQIQTAEFEDELRSAVKPTGEDDAPIA